MSRRLLAVALPLGLAACDRGPLAPEAAASSEASAAASSARMHLTGERRAALFAAVADARLRLLPAVAGESDRATPLDDALRGLDESLTADDGPGLATAVSRTEAAMGSLAPEDADSLAAEMDAIRLLLAELRLSASAGRSITSEE
jgi:hypothetical protein